MNLNNKKKEYIKRIGRHLISIAMILGVFILTSPRQNSTDSSSVVTEGGSPIVGIAAGAASFEDYYLEMLDRANSAQNLGVNHELEDFAGIPRTEEVVDDKDISFTYSFHTDKTELPFGIYEPSSAEISTISVPLIVWLHGSGEVGVPESVLHNRGLHNVMDNWELYGFHAYVVTPQLAGKNSTGNWHNKTSVEQVEEVIDYMSQNYNIDITKIYLCGHSLGGMGTSYIASKIPERFAAIMPLSGYNCGANLETLTMPMRGYVGSVGDEGSYSYMKTMFNNKTGFGLDNLYTVPVGHGQVPAAAFNLDEDANGRSDVIEWLLSN